MNLDLDVTEAFNKIALMTGRVRVIKGATRSSKTWSICQLLIIYGFQNSNTKKNVVIASRSIPHVKNCMEDFFEILDGLGVYDAKNHNKVDNIYKIGKVLYKFISCETPSKLKGVKSHVCYINEANEVLEASFRQLRMRNKEYMFLDLNPENQCWVDDQVKKDESNLLSLTYRDNKYIDDATLELFEEQQILADEGDKEAANFLRVYRDGLDGILSGGVFQQFEETLTIPEDAKYICHGLDWGASDPNACVKVYQLNTKDIYIEEVFYNPDLLFEDMANILKPDEDLLRGGLIVADAQGRQHISELRTYGFNIMPCKKGANSIDLGLKVMKGFNLFIKGENLINEFKNYRYATTPDGTTIAGSYKGNDHLIDAARYAICYKLSKSSRNYNTLKFI